MSGPLEWRDRVFWEMSRRYAVRPMVCGILLTLDRAPDIARLRARMQALVEAFPRLRLRVESDGREPIWSEHEFMLDDHLRAVDVELTHAELAADMRARLDPARPPWRLSVLRVGGQHALYLQWHHALSDGEGMLALLGSLSDGIAEPGVERDWRALDPALRVDPHVEIELGASARARPPGLLWSLVRARKSERAIGSDRFAALPIFTTLDADTLTRLREANQVSTNELLVALASWAVLEHARRRGRAPGLVRLLSPLGDRDNQQRVLLGNHSRALRLRLDVRDLPTVPQLIARVRAASREQLRRGRAVPYGLYRLIFGLPDALGDRLLAAIPPYLVNYLPWSTKPRWIAGARVERIDGLPPMLPFHGCTFAIAGYRGELHGNLVCDLELLADPELLVACLDEAVAAC